MTTQTAITSVPDMVTSLNDNTETITSVQDRVTSLNDTKTITKPKTWLEVEMQMKTMGVGIRTLTSMVSQMNPSVWEPGPATGAAHSGGSQSNSEYWWPSVVCTHIHINDCDTGRTETVVLNVVISVTKQWRMKQKGLLTNLPPLCGSVWSPRKQ